MVNKMISPKFKITAYPDFECITTRAVVSYHAELTDPQNDTISKGTKFKWACLNDPSTTREGAPAVFHGPEEQSWKNAKWSFAGRHKILLFVTYPDGKKDVYEKKQWVDKAANILGREFDPDSGILVPGPFQVLQQKKTIYKVLENISKTNPPPHEKEKEFKSRLNHIKEYIEKLNKKFSNLQGKEGLAVKAMHIATETSARTELLLYLVNNTNDNETSSWILVDWTNPVNRNTTGVYKGKGETHEEAIKNLIKEWNSGNRYPEGLIEYDFKVPQHLIELKGKFKSDGKSFEDQLSSWLAKVSIGSAAVALIFLPAPGSRIVSAALWASLFSGTASNVININQRHKEGFENWHEDTFDGLSIIGNLFAGAGLAWKICSKVTSASMGLKAVLVGQVSTDGLQGILLGQEYLSEFKSIQNNKNLSPDERLSKLVELFRSAAVAGALTYISVKGTKIDIENLNTGKTAYTKNQIENEKNIIDLDKKNMSTPVKGHETESTTIIIQTEPGSIPLGREATLAKAKNNKLNRANDEAVQVQTEKGHPVNCITGAVVDTQTDFVLPGRIPLQWQRNYNSQQKDIQGLSIGNGWRTPADAYLETDENGLVIFTDGSKGASVFKYLPTQPGVLYDETGQKKLFKDENLYKVSDKSGLTYSFSLKKESPSFVKQISDSNSNFINFIRDKNGLKEIGISSGQTIKVHTVSGKIKHMHLSLARGMEKDLVKYSYDIQTGDLLSAADPQGGTTEFEYINHLITKITLKTGLSFSYKYDNPASIEAKCVHTFGDGNLYDYRFEYSENNDRTIITNSLNQKEIYEFDENSKPVKVYDHENNLTLYEYDFKGRPSSITDPAGKTIQYTYDEKGNLTLVTRPDKTKVKIEYNKNDKPVKITDPNKNIWEQSWDEKGRLKSRISPYGAKTEYNYNEKGDLLSVKDPKGAVTKFDVDENGLIRNITDPLGNTTGLKLDEFGNLLSASDPMGRVTSYEYDEKSRIIKIVKPSGRKIECRYDDEDNLVEYQNESGEITKFEYTGINQISKRINNDGTFIKYTYNTEEQLVKVTNESGETFKFKRDHAGRIIEETDYYGNTKTYKYDKAGALKSTTNPLNETTEFKFDPLGRLSSKKYHDGKIETFTYDPNGNLIQHENQDIKVNRIFDEENRIINEYDVTGNRIRRTSKGNDIRYEYDISGSPKKIRINDEEIDIRRDKTGLPKKEIFSTGLERSYTHNKEGLLTDQHIFGKNLNIKRSYKYDLLGNLTAKTDLNKGSSYFTYDPKSQITKAINPENKIEEFLYDPAGNLFKERKKTGNATRNLYHKDTDYIFDAAGSLTQRKDKSGKTLFNWNQAGMLRSAISPDGTKTKMEYDAQSRRLSKETNNIKTTFGWDGDYLLWDNIGGNNPREFVFYPESFEPLAFIDKEKNIHYFHNDAVGLPQEITDSKNNIVWSARYDSLGNIEKIYENKINNPIRFQGQYYDEELGLSYNRHRYFNADTGSFISIDPLGLEAGTNLYRYAPNVWGWIDPLGLCKKMNVEKVQRWMSNAELESTQKTGLLRGGRDGTHYVTDAANTNAFRARQRLALPQTPEVRVTLEVPKGNFSLPSKVEPAFNMPGGGMERTANEKIFVKIIKVE